MTRSEIADKIAERGFEEREALRAVLKDACEHFRVQLIEDLDAQERDHALACTATKHPCTYEIQVIAARSMLHNIISELIREGK